MVQVSIAAIILGITLSFMVGPVFLLLLDIAMNKGVKKALAFDSGVIFADILFIIAILYSSSFLKGITDLAAVYFVGGAVIIAYGIYNVRTSTIKKNHLKETNELPEATDAPLSLYIVKGFFMNFLNVGVLAYWLATVVVMKASVGDDMELMKLYFIVTVSTYALVDVLKILASQKLKARLTDKVLIKIEHIVGYILIGFGLLMITRGILQHLGYTLETLLGIA